MSKSRIKKDCLECKDIRTSGKLRFMCHDCGKFYNSKTVPESSGYRVREVKTAPKV